MDGLQKARIVLPARDLGRELFACLLPIPVSVPSPGCGLRGAGWEVCLNYGSVTRVSVSYRASMEITSSKGQAFLVEPCGGMSPGDGWAGGSSGEL